MKKKVFRERYSKYYSDFKVLDKEELKEAKAEVIEESKPKRKRSKKEDK